MIFDNALFSNGGKGPLGEPVSIQGWKRQPQIKISKDGKIMTNNQKIKNLIFIPLLIFTFLIQRTPAYARDGGGSRGGGGGSRGGGGGFRGGDYHGGWGGYHGGWGGPRWGWGGWCWALPLAATAVVLAGATYYYDEGIYYQRMGNGYIVVPEPVGPVVTTIPAGYQPTIINGVAYYTINGVTYMYTPNGYQMVQQPTIVQAATQPNIVIAPNPAAPQQQAAPNPSVENAAQGISASNAQDSFSVNIPNSKGTYTPVTLRKSGNGFIGPQGEFYTQFPSIEQLKAMYAK